MPIAFAGKIVWHLISQYHRESRHNANNCCPHAFFSSTCYCKQSIKFKTFCENNVFWAKEQKFTINYDKLITNESLWYVQVREKFLGQHEENWFIEYESKICLNSDS